jgi:uncharacterized protein (DUF1786 family)
MKAGIFFTGSGLIVVLTSYASLTAPNFVEKLMAKGINKFIAYEVEVEEVKKKSGKHFEVIMKDLHQEGFRDGYEIMNFYPMVSLGEHRPEGRQRLFFQIIAPSLSAHLCTIC